MTKRKILVPVGFGASSDAALEFALNSADRDDAEVVLLHVFEASEADEAFVDSEAGEEFARRIELAQSRRGEAVSSRIEFGAEPIDGIRDVLDREWFDMVVLGGEREPGEVALDVADCATCKVVSVVARAGTRVPGPITVSWRHPATRPPPRTSYVVPKYPVGEEIYDDALFA